MLQLRHIQQARATLDARAILCPVGGSGLASGISVAVSTRQPSLEVIGVEPEGAASMARVNEAAIHRAMRHLLYHAKLMAEPGAAVGVACLLEDAAALPPSGDIVVVITGGNLGREELEGAL